ncbi:hypothetical protein E2C01_092993 [Portunus trituberculatus]|uniref:Uncharacterized protein n=1 Tax=Portunus trituberculatus TaxID=210409 RepID=A0A5B7JS60_PORTR|nr:hypothetical protein [Portunus trituberculatus]
MSSSSLTLAEKPEKVVGEQEGDGPWAPRILSPTGASADPAEYGSCCLSAFKASTSPRKSAKASNTTDQGTGEVRREPRVSSALSCSLTESRCPHERRDECLLLLLSVL